MMNHYPFRPGRTVARATSHLVKWTLIALLILVLALTTILSSPDLVQREATTLRQHETIHHLDAGPTMSPLTKAMKVLLHHLPARRSEIVDPDAVHRPVLGMKTTRVLMISLTASHKPTLFPRNGASLQGDAKGKASVQILLTMATRTRLRRPLRATRWMASRPNSLTASRSKTAKSPIVLRYTANALHLVGNATVLRLSTLE
jgi:hypothetical protein